MDQLATSKKELQLFFKFSAITRLMLDGPLAGGKKGDL